MDIKHLSQDDLARRWNVSKNTLERWRSSGFGPFFLKLLGRVVYRLADIEAFEAQSLRRSTAESAQKEELL